jgi:hypothetical protein
LDEFPASQGLLASAVSNDPKIADGHSIQAWLHLLALICANACLQVSRSQISFINFSALAELTALRFAASSPQSSLAKDL